MNIGKRTFVLVAGTLLVGLVLLVAFFGSRFMVQDTSASNSEIVSVRRGTLIATVSATGAVSPLRLAELAFSANGPLTRLDVKQGDRVKAGQILATLDTRTLDYQLAQAEANLAAAQAKADQLKNPSPADLVAAQASVASAEAALAQLKTPAQNDLIIAKSDVDKAKAALDRAQAEYDRIGGASNPMIGMLPQSLSLQQASLDYQKAIAAYNSKVSPNDSQLKQGLSNAEQARATLARLTNPNSNDVKAALANVDQARAARDLARAQLDNAILRAPFDGVVTHVDFDLGSFAPAGRTILGVADTAQLRVKLNIDETDIARVSIGQSVNVDLDAYPDSTLNAQVTDVAASATTTQGVVNYVVTITLDPGSVPVKIGMTANANIVVAKKDNALLVPNRAIRASNSKRFVTVQKHDTQAQEVEVKLGLANEQETEIVSGVNEGDQILIASTQQNNLGGPFGAKK
ncbi:MAG: efflux RND transporter periplasmic adaptor subunit [Acidobacteriota bacterium]